MKPAKPVVLILAVFGLLILFGCLQKLSGGASLYEQEYRDSLSRVPVSHPNMTEECRMGSCWCMVCKNGTNIFGPLNNLIGGYCYWNKNCTTQTVADLNNRTMNPDLTIRQFMVGVGPTFGDFSFANTMCTNRLSMSVQWLLATNGTTYLAPDAARTMCFLSKDIIPVYILYSNSTNINDTRAGDIAEILGTQGDDLFLGRLSEGPVGPVVVVTEIDFDANKASQVAAQVRAIDTRCRNDRAHNQTYCFIAVAPKMNDFQALNDVMNALGPDKDKVDLVAYGVNGKYVHSCDGPRIRQQAINFSSYALYNWSKPTIIPYILFDPGTNDTDNSCTWTESDVVSAYAAFSPSNMLSLQKRGVIGIAPYAFFNTTPTTGITNPLNCTDCALGRNEQRMRAWFGGCQVYTNVTRATGSVSGGQTQIVFGNESGTVCNQNTQMDYFRGLSFTGRDIMQPQSAQLRSSVPRFFSCDACLMANASRSFTNMFSGLNANNPQFGASDRVCKSFPEIEQWSSARNLDPMLVRAFVYTESNFEPCAAAKVCSRECIRDHCTDGCFPAGDFAGNSECYAKPAYDEMYDPAGTCAFAIASNSGQARPDWRYCAFGLMQSIEPPYTFWPAQYRPDGQDGPYFDVFDRSGFRTTAEIGTARGCNPNFNPFLPADSVCIGTAKIESALRAAKAWINSHRPQLNWDTTANGDFDKTNLFAAYVAGNMYAGFWGSTARRGDHPCPSGMTNGDCWAYRFAQSWAVNATYCASSDGASDSRCEGGAPKWHPPFDCYGETDWMRYVQECELPFLPRAADPGRTKIEAYIQLAKGCSDYMCPDGKVLFTAMERPLPASGTPYLPDSTTPGGGTGTGSGGTGTGG